MPKSGFLLLRALFWLQGADYEGGFGLIPALFLLQGRGTKVRLFYVKRAEISTFRLGGGRRAGGGFSLGPLSSVIREVYLFFEQTKKRKDSVQPSKPAYVYTAPSNFVTLTTGLFWVMMGWLEYRREHIEPPHFYNMCKNPFTCTYVYWCRWF